MKIPRLITTFLVLLVVLLLPLVVQAQDVQDIVTLEAEAGFGTYFRENQWFPVRLQVRNDGDDINGRITVRPETSGRVVNNAYSVPIDLPNGSEKVVFLYLQARTFPPEIRVELLDENDQRVTSQQVTINSIEAQDQLYVIVTGPTGTPLPLNDVHVGGFLSYQANWGIENIPDNPEALRSITTMIITNVDSTQFSTTQLEAISDWVTMGGHLVVTGGFNWQQTSETLVDLLPFTPTDSETVNDISPLATIVGAFDTILDEPTVIATGETKENTHIIATTEDNQPLLIRHQFGAGTVDYLTADPALEPLRSWDNVNDLWFSIVSSTAPKPAWTIGLQGFGEAARAIAILPGVNLLPSVASLCLFLAGYILLVGPLNYVILSRLNRREWAWVTIPLLIILFAVIAWTFGFNLRGSTVTVSRLNVVESWADQDTAQVRQLVGLLSPRRSTYSLNMPEDRFVRVLPPDQNTLGASNLVQAGTEIIQDATFQADEIAVDGGIFANFTSAGAIEAPEIGGSVTWTFNPANNTQSIQGAVRNDSEVTLFDPVILAQGVAYHLNDPLEPGDIVTIGATDITIANEETASVPSPIEYTYGQSISALGNYFNRSNTLLTVNDIMGENAVNTNQFRPGISAQEQSNFRRQSLLEAYIRDQYSTTARGTQVYLAAWSDEWEDDLQVEGAEIEFVDTTLYLVALNVTVEHPVRSQQVTVPSYMFTWVTRQREGFFNGGGADLNLQPDNFVTLRFMPLADAILQDVEEIRLLIDRASGLGRFVPVEMWDWRNEVWEQVGLSTDELFTISGAEDVSRFLGPNNQVEVRLTLDSPSGTATIRTIRLEQAGHF